MTAVDGHDLQPLTVRTPAVGRFARRWAGALARTGRMAGTVPEVGGELRPLTLRLARAVRDGEPDPALGRDVGAVLMRRGHGTAAVIAPTVVTVLDFFAADFEVSAPDGPVVADRLAAVAAAMTEGFADAIRDHALAAQEELQRAALAAVRSAEADRQTSEARFRALFAQAAVGIGLISTTGRVIDANAAWAAMMGYTVEQMRGRTIAEVVMPGGSQPAMVVFKELLAGARDSFRMEIAHDNRKGERLYLDLSVSKVSSPDDGDFLVGVAVDITSRKLLEVRLWHESRHDPLTGLPNRTLFFEQLDVLLAAPDSRVGVCYIDLDGFKSINDGLGHDVGDRLLVRVAARLGDAVSRPGCLFARLGGDEFGILVDCARADPGALADSVLAALAGPVEIDGRELLVSASVGVVDTSTAGAHADELMRAADITLYAAKARGRGRWERHDPQRGARQVTRHTLATEMSGALGRGEFFLEYQPLVSLSDGGLRRVEALVRWQHPRLGLLYPDQFIELAEQNGLIVSLGRWVLRQACRAAYEWHRRFPAAAVGINVNVAVGQLRDPDLPAQVRATLAETGLPPHLLYLELTESAVLGEAPGPIDALMDLAAAGVRLVIDDFGTGYSNLVHLSRLPACELKIAGSFLQPSTGDPAGDKIIPAIISLAHSLGLTVTAEGVEDAAQADRLRELKCDTAQGWHFAVPVSAAAIAALIARKPVAG